MSKIDQLISEFASFIWGLPLLILLIGGGFYLLILSRFLPFRFFGHAIQVLRGKYDNPEDEGQISNFQELTMPESCQCNSLGTCCLYRCMHTNP